MFATTADELQATITCRDAFWGLIFSYAMIGRVRDAREACANAYRGYRGIGNQWVLRLAVQQELELLILPYFTDEIREREGIESIALNAWRQAIQVVSNEDDVTIEADYGLGFLDGRWREARRAATICSAPHWESASRYLALRSAAEFDLHLGRFEQFWERVYSMLPEGSRTQPGKALMPTALKLQQLAAELCIYQDDLEQARAWLDANDAWFAWSESILLRAEGQVIWSRYFLATGDFEGARRSVEEARTIARNPRQPMAMLVAGRALGELDTLEGSYDDASEHLQSALRLAKICRAPYEIALTQLAQSELAWATRDILRNQGFSDTGAYDV